MSRAHHRRGFTLLELLVAVTITLLLAGLLLTVATQTMTVWQRTQARALMAGNARLILDAIERDLQVAVLRRDGKHWLRVDVFDDAPALGSHGWLLQANSSTPIKPSVESRLLLPPSAPDGTLPGIGSARFGVSGAWLRLISANQENTGAATLPAAISYQIARRPLNGAITTANPADVRYTLFRAFLPPNSTFTTVQPEMFAGLTTPAAFVNPPNSDALGSNVVDFAVWLYRRDHSGQLVPLYPTTAPGNLQQFASGNSTETPVVADVMVRILTEEGAALVAAMENPAFAAERPAEYNTAGKWWWAAVEANSQVFVRRVELRSRAP